MASISSRAKSFRQPEGGFLSITRFEQLDDNRQNREDNDFDSIINRTLKKHLFQAPYDSYEKSIKLLKKTMLNLFRLEMGDDRDKVFEKALKGAANINDTENAAALLNRIKKADGFTKMLLYLPDEAKPSEIKGISPDDIEDLLDEPVINAVCNLTSYEYYANGRNTGKHIPIQLHEQFLSYFFETTWGIKNTCTYIGPFVNKINFGNYVSSPSLRPAYTDTVNAGDIDLMTNKTIWKIYLSTDSKPKPSTPETLEVLMQYVMLCRTDKKYRTQTEYLGIYDPNRDLAYYIRTSDISDDVFSQVEKEVIGY